MFQAEDGIRDVAVTGVQTCALPIWREGVRVRMWVQRVYVLARELCKGASSEDEVVICTKLVVGHKTSVENEMAIVDGVEVVEINRFGVDRKSVV